MRILTPLFTVLLAVFTWNCSRGAAQPAAKAADVAPPAAQIEAAPDASLVKVDRPEQFALVAAASYSAASEIVATGQVVADVSRTVPVISLASGRVVETHARLGDAVKKGQLLLKVRSSDISMAYSDYRKAVASEALAKTQLQRAQILYDKGALAQKDLEVSQDVDVRARVDVETTENRLRVLGVGTSNPSDIVEIYAPTDGVIIEQNVTVSAGVKTLDNSPNLFTIADLSNVWILCDVYENQLSQIRTGEGAVIRVAAYPNLTLRARVQNIGPILDATSRTAKVRLELKNPGQLRVGMFVNATFQAQQKETRAAVPSTAVLHLHDRDWVYTPVGSGQFRRLEVSGGTMLPGNLQEIRKGLVAGQQVVTNALVLQNKADQ